MPRRAPQLARHAALRLLAAVTTLLVRRPAPSDSRPLAAYKRVLVVRADEIGDLVLTSAFLRELRANVPDAWITLVVRTGNIEVARHCPYVNEVIGYHWEGSLSWGLVRSLRSAATLVRKNLRPARFDLAILPRWNTDYYGASHLVYLSGATRRFAYSESVGDTKARLNSGYDRLFTDTLSDSSPKHEVERNLAVLRFLGGTVTSDALEVWTSADDAVAAQAMTEAAGLSPSEMVVVFGVGARAARRTWPAENFLAIARWLQQEYRARVVIVGDTSDLKTARWLADALGPAVVNFAGRTTLGQLTEILKRADLFVGNDSGPMHLAAAAGVPVVEISCHPRSGTDTDVSSPVAFRPWRTPSRVLQPEYALAPCSDACRADAAHCITQITVAHVKEAVAPLLDLSRQGTG